MYFDLMILFRIFTLMRGFLDAYLCKTLNHVGLAIDFNSVELVSLTFTILESHRGAMTV